MPITSSAKKALRQNKRRKVQNAARKDAYKKALKNFRKLAGAKGSAGTGEAKTFLPALFKALDKAAKTNAITANKAARLKSRAARLVR